MKAKYFATVKSGRIATLTDATPEHELDENQFPLTEWEWAIARHLPIHPDNKGIDLEGSKKIIDNLLQKLKEMQNE